MGKRVLKIFGIVFGVAIVTFGAIIGVMALQGKFKKPYVEPTSLYFDLPYDEKSKSYYMDVTYYCNEVDTKGEKKNNIYSFTLKANPDNTTELDCSMAIESGSDLIDFCDMEGNPNSDIVNVKINSPVYFKISSEFDNEIEDYKLTNGVVKIYFNSSNNLCNGYLNINIDRQVSSVSLKDYTIKDSPNNVHKDGKFDFEKVVYESVKLTEAPTSWDSYYVLENGKYVQVDPETHNFNEDTKYYMLEIDKTLYLTISANDPYPLVPIFAPENSNQPFTSVEGKTCEIYFKNGNVYENVKTTTSSHIYLDDEGVYRFISSEPGKHEFYLVTYPTYAIQKEAEEFFANETNSDNIIFNNEFAITRKVEISVQNFGIQSVQFRDNDEVFNVGLDLFKDNYFVLNDDTLGGENINLKVSMFNNKGYEEISRLNQIKFFDSSDFIEGNVTFTASSLGTQDGEAQIVLDGKNAILTNFGVEGVDGIRNYTINYISASENLNGQTIDADCLMLTIKFNDNENDSLRLVFKILSERENGLIKLESNHCYLFKGTLLSSKISADETFVCSTPNLLGKYLGKDTQDNKTYTLGTIKVGSYLVFTEGIKNKNGLFEISSTGYAGSKVFKVLPTEQQTNLKLYLFVVNEDYSCKYTEKPATISVDPENTTYTKESEIDDLKIKYSKIVGEDKPLVETSEIAVNSLININSGSYRLPLMFVEETDIKVRTVGVTITKGSTTYRLVGYIEDGKFVNNIKPLENVMGMQKVYTVILKYSYNIKTSEDLAEDYIEYLTEENSTISINTNMVANLDSFNLDSNIISIKIKYAEKLEDEAIDTGLEFVGSIYSGSFEGEEDTPELQSNAIYEIKENSYIHTFVINLDEESAFNDSQILSLFTGEDAENNLLKLNEYFTLKLNLFTSNNTLLQTGIINYTKTEGLDGKITYEYSANNPILNLYFEISSAKYDEDNNRLLFEFRTKNDPSDTYVGEVLTENSLKGYYFQFEFNYEGETACSSKLVVKSTAVTGYVIKVGETQYNLNDYNGYKVVYDIAWDSTNKNYTYTAYLKHKTDANQITIPLEYTGTSLTDKNLLSTTYLKALPYYSSPDEYSYLSESSNNSILNVTGSTVEILKTGTANITLTNTTNSQAKTVIEVEVISSKLSLNVKNSKESIGDNSLPLYTGTDSNISYCYDNGSNSLFNNVIAIDTDKYLPLVTFGITNLPDGYFAQELRTGSFAMADYGTNSYIDYIQIKDNRYKLVAVKPADWDEIDFPNEHYYKLGDGGYEEIYSAYEFELYQGTINWEEIDLNVDKYYVYDNESKTYTLITDKEVGKQASKIYTQTNTSTWEDEKIYQRYNTVASLRLYKDESSYQWRLEREEKYVLTSIGFTLTANTIVGSASITYTYLSAVKIEKNANNTMATDDVITYYKGTNLQLSSLVGSTDEKETLFKLTNATGDASTLFKLQYKKYEENSQDFTWEDLGVSGTNLAFDSTKTETKLKDLDLNTVYEARIYYNDYKFYEFKFKVVENLLYDATTDKKENSISNPHVLTWGANTEIDLTWTKDSETNVETGQIKYYEYSYDLNSDPYLSYSSTGLTSVTSDITYNLEDGDYAGIISIDGSKLNLGWVQFAGSKTYAVKLQATKTETQNSKIIDVIYYVKVQSDFSISRRKDENNEDKQLPDLNAYEPIDFDINEYFTIKNGSDKLTITSVTIKLKDTESSLFTASENNYTKVHLTGAPSDWNGYYIYNNGNYEEATSYVAGVDYFVKDKTKGQLIFNNAVGGNKEIEITFNIFVNNSIKQIEEVDNSYDIVINNYQLPIKEDAYIVGNGNADTLFTALFKVTDWNTEVWDKVEQIDVDLKNDTNNNVLIADNSYRDITKDTENMLKLGAISTIDSEYEVTIGITLTYENGETHTYEQVLKVKSAYYATITYDFNDLIETFDKDTLEKLSEDFEINLPSTMPYDIALTGEVLDVKDKFTVYNSIDNSKVENSTAQSITLVGGIGYTENDLKKVTTSGTTITIGELTNVGFLIFRVSNGEASCYYMVKVTPHTLGYTSVLKDGVRTTIKKEYIVDSDITIQSLLENASKDKFENSFAEIASYIDISETDLKIKTLNYYITDVNGENPFNDKVEGDCIDNTTINEPKNPTIITVAVVLTYEGQKVHLLSYEITLLPNVKVTANVDADTNISTDYSNVKITSTGKHYEYNMNLSYYYNIDLDNITGNNIISLSDLFTVTGSNSLSNVNIIGLSNEDSQNINVVDNQLQLIKNISENITFDLVLTYGELNVTVHVTYNKFENSNALRKYILGWDGTEFNYELLFSELVPNYKGSYTGIITGKDSTYSEATISFEEFVVTDAKIYKTLTITLESIDGTPTYVFDIEIDPSINVEINKGTSVGDSIETTVTETTSKLDVEVIVGDNPNTTEVEETHTEVIIKDKDVEVAVIRICQGTPVSKLNFYYTNLDGVVTNEFISGTTANETTSTDRFILLESKKYTINFIPSASNFSGKLVFTIDTIFEPLTDLGSIEWKIDTYYYKDTDNKHKLIQNETDFEAKVTANNIYKIKHSFDDTSLFVTVSQTYDATLQYKVSNQEKETFVVGDNLTIEEFINGNRFDYVGVESTATWEENKYYYFDKSTNRYLSVDTYLINRYRANLYVVTEYDKLATSAVYDDSINYYIYNTDTCSYDLAEDINADNFTDNKANLYIQNNAYTKLVDNATYHKDYTYYTYNTEKETYEATSINEENFANNKANLYIKGKYQGLAKNDAEYYSNIQYYYSANGSTNFVELSNTNTEDKYYFFSYLFNKHKTEYYLRPARTNEAVTIDTYVLITNEDVWEQGKYYLYNSESLEYELIDGPSLFNSSTSVYKKVQVKVNANRINIYELVKNAEWQSDTYYTFNTTLNKYVLIQTEEVFKVTDKIYKLSENSNILTPSETTLNTLKVDIYYNNAGSWVLDSNKAFAEVTNNTIYFKQVSSLKLVFFNGTGLSLECIVNVETADVNVDNITLNNLVSGNFVDDNNTPNDETDDKAIEYISVTLNDLKKGYKLATLTYSPSDQNMFALYCASENANSYIRISEGLIDYNSVKLNYYFDDNYNLMIKTTANALTNDYIYYDLYLITGNGIVKTIRLYVTDVVVNLPSDTPSLWANTEGNKLSDLGMYITNADLNGDTDEKGNTIIDINDKIDDYTSGNYQITYAGAYNRTDGVKLSATNKSIIKVNDLNSETFNLGGVDEEKLITLYYDLKYKVSEDVYVVIKSIEFPIIVKNNIIIGGGDGFTQYDSAYNGTIYLNNYTTTDGVTTIDLMTSSDGSKYRDEYITYQDLSPLTSVYLDGNKENSMLSYVSSYLKFEIIEDSYNTIKDDLSKPETLIENSEIDENGILKIKHDKNGTVKLKVTAQYSPSYYKIFILNIKSTIDVYVRYSETQYDADQDYKSGEEYDLVTLDYNGSTTSPIRLSKYSTDENFEDIQGNILNNTTTSFTVGYSYLVHSDIATMLANINTLTFSAEQTAELLSTSQTLNVTLPSVPMDGNYHFVTYKIIFTVNGTEQMYLYNLKVQNPVNLELTSDYTTKKITVGSGANSGSKLYLYNSTLDSSLFTSASNIITDTTNNIKLVIYDNGNDATVSEPKKVYFAINKDAETSNYYIDLTKGVLYDEDNKKVDFDTTNESLKVSTLFSNSMSFDLVFVDTNNKDLYTIIGWTMTATSSMSATNNKALTDIFTVAELGADLATKKFSAVVNSDSVDAGTFELTGTISSTSQDEKTITRQIGENTYTYNIRSRIITGTNNGFYNNNLKVYYIVTSQTSFVELPTGYYISKIIDDISADYVIDLADTIKLFDSTKTDWTQASTTSGVKITETVEGDNITASDTKITITKAFLEELEASGETTYSFVITVNNIRQFSVELTLNLSSAN